MARFDPAALRRQLLLRGLSDRQAALRAGINRETMSRAINGEVVGRRVAHAIMRMLQETEPLGGNTDVLREDG